MIKQKILFNCNFEYMQCNKVFEITGAIKNSSRAKSKNYWDWKSGNATLV